MDNGKVLKSTFRFPLGAACAAIKRRWRDDFAAQAAPKVGIGLFLAETRKFNYLKYTEASGFAGMPNRMV
jgi:hypothetical protein